jgi:hypothetical protein
VSPSAPTRIPGQVPGLLNLPVEIVNLVLELVALLDQRFQALSLVDEQPLAIGDTNGQAGSHGTSSLLDCRERGAPRYPRFGSIATSGEPQAPT